MDGQTLVAVGSKLANRNIDQKGIHQCIDSITKTLVIPGKKIPAPCRPQGTLKLRKKRKKTNSKGWYTKDCKALCTVLRHQSKEFSKDLFNPSKRDTKAKRAYKKTVEKLKACSEICD